jgi:hypothetical protein
MTLGRKNARFASATFPSKRSFIAAHHAVLSVSATTVSTRKACATSPATSDLIDSTSL